LAASAIVLASGCRQRVVPVDALDACAVVDSLLRSAGPARPCTVAGRALFDLEQYRLRGRFRLSLRADGDATIEFGGTTLLGGVREDVAVSWVADTLRVLDRERGRYYEGEKVEELLTAQTGLEGDWGRALVRVLGGGIRCGTVDGVTVDAGGARGRVDGQPFRVELDEQSGRLSRVTWPDPVEGGTFADRLEVRYAWEGGRLRELTASLPERGWRARLQVDHVLSE
jgi:hypothetical protein